MKGYDKVLEVTSKIGDCLPQFKTCEGLFRENKRVRDILFLFYKDLLDFYAITIRFFQTKGMFKTADSTNKTQSSARLEAFLRSLVAALCSQDFSCDGDHRESQIAFR